MIKNQSHYFIYTPRIDIYEYILERITRNHG